MYEQVASTGIAAFQQAAKLLAGAREASDSLVGYTSPARVEPLLLIDDRLLFSDLLPPVQQSLLSQVCGYYLQAAALSMNVGGIEVVKHLDKLNPSRDGRSTIAGHVLGMESYKEAEKQSKLGMESYADFTHRLPVPGDERNRVTAVAMEEVKGGVEAPKDISSEVNRLANLSVGKLVNVKVSDGKNTAVIPVSIRLMANSITRSGLLHILSAGSKDVTFRERIAQWRSGEIEFWRDLVLCQDLIDAHKRHLKDDKDGIYSAILNRRANNAVASLISGNFSIASASNVIIMSQDTQTEVEVELGIRLSDARSRQKVFEKTYLMIMAVVDTDRDRVTFYYRGIPDSTSISIRDLKSAESKGGADINDILAAYRLGNAPSQ